jgi:competence protein ComEA
VRVREERGGFTALRQLEEVPGLAGKVDEEELAGLGLTVG